MAGKYYAVRVGREPGIYRTWSETQEQVKGFPNAKFKGFPTEKEAQEFMDVKKKKDSEPKSPYEVWVDGSFKDGSYAYSLVFVLNNNKIYEESGIGEDLEAASMNNVAGETLAARRAVEIAKEIDDDLNGQKIRIMYDYAGIEDWVVGDWQAGNRFTRDYTKFMKDNIKLVQFEKIEGHSGLKWNDYADALAKQALGIEVDLEAILNRP